MRREYAGELTEADLAATWTEQLAAWLADAVAATLPEPNAMVVATADPAGRPSTRSVLLKGYDERGLVFFTNYSSRKGAELAANPYASALLPWYPLYRQVIAAGPVEKVDRAETEEYFAQRPYGSQLGAWASPQSAPIPSRQVVEDAWARAGERFPEGQPVPAPPHWGGFRLIPQTVEFWQGRRSRLHDRLRFRRTGSTWIVERLAP